MEKAYPVFCISRLRMGIDGEGIRTLVIMQGCPLKCKYCINPQTRDMDNDYQMMTAEEVYSKISIDRPYLLATNGGITFGGGEPLLYSEIISEMRSLCDPEMTINVETSLHVPWKNIENTIKSVDEYYVDIKTMDPQIYKKYTGKELEVSFNNLKRLLCNVEAKQVVVRIPEIDGLVDKDMQMKAQRQLQEIGVERFDLFKYKIS